MIRNEKENKRKNKNYDLYNNRYCGDNINIAGIRCNIMNIDKFILFIVTMIWTVWLIVKTVGTKEFNFIDSYVTIGLLYYNLFIYWIDKE